MKFRLNFERLEMRDNPSSSDPTAVIPPGDPVDPPPLPTPIITPGTGTPGIPVADPISPTPP